MKFRYGLTELLLWVPSMYVLGFSFHVYHLVFRREVLKDAQYGFIFIPAVPLGWLLAVWLSQALRNAKSSGRQTKSKQYIVWALAIGGGVLTFFLSPFIARYLGLMVHLTIYWGNGIVKSVLGQ